MSNFGFAAFVEKVRKFGHGKRSDRKRKLFELYE